MLKMPYVKFNEIMTALVMECWDSVAEVEMSGMNDQRTRFLYHP